MAVLGASSVVVTALSLLLLVGAADPAHAAATQTGGPVVASGTAPVRFEAPAGGIVEVEGLGRYRGTVEVRVGPDGDLIVVDELPIEEYVAGVDEMPLRWPLEALKAQAVAARTYAWYQLSLGTYERRGYGYDICDSTACQVFRGAAVVEEPLFGDRWQQAVQDTAGQVLVHDGGPALARYHSSSGGRTLPNEEVYPRSGPRPYLPGVDDPQDEVSPYHRWEVSFPRDDFDAMMARGEQLGAVGHVTGVAVVDVAGGPDRVRVSGDGAVVEVDVARFRAFVSAVAPDLWPGRYPSASAAGGTLPVTLPSSRFDVTVTDRAVTIEGRGFGHGVGMGQWGAMGRAADGANHTDILAAYYGGLRPQPTPDLPDTIRVGLRHAREPARLTTDVPVRLTVGGRELATAAVGTFDARLVEEGMALTAPAGFGTPLEVAPTVTSRSAPSLVETVRLSTRVNKTSRLLLRATDPAGTTVVDRELGVIGPGDHHVDWSLDAGDGAGLPPGTYAATLVAVDEQGRTRGTPVTVDLAPVATPGVPARDLLSADAPGAGADPLLVATVAGALLGAGAALIRRPT